jgi:hypothetical protein
MDSGEALNMSHERDKDFAIIRGGLYGKRDTRSHTMRLAALELRERLVALMAGRKKSRALNSVQAGVTNPLGAPIKMAGELAAARVSYEDTRRLVIVPQERAVARLYGRHFDTGEHTPPGRAA